MSEMALVQQHFPSKKNRLQQSHRLYAFAFFVDVAIKKPPF
jgi:hypothetical protein